MKRKKGVIATVISVSAGIALSGAAAMAAVPQSAPATVVAGEVKVGNILPVNLRSDVNGFRYNVLPGKVELSCNYSCSCLCGVRG